MDWAWLTSYLVAIVALGTTGVVLSAREEKRLLSHTLGLIAVFGAGSLGYGLFLLALIGVRPTRWTFVVLSAAAVVFGGSHLFRKRKILLPKLRPSPLQVGWRRHVGLCALLVVFQGIVLAHALAFRLYEGDAYAIWGLKAKVIAAEGIVPRPSYFTDVSLSYSHLDYPLMVPFLMSGVYGVLGRVDDQMAKLSLPVLYFGLLCLVFAFSKRRSTTPMAFAVTAIVMGAPVMLRWAGSGNADVPLTAFYIASVIFLLEWGEDLNWRSCMLCGVMSAFAAFTKNEGLVLGALNCIVIFLLPTRSTNWRCRLAGVGLWVAVFVVLILPWVFWSSEIPRTHENYIAHLRFSEITGNVFRLPIILAEFGRQIVSVWRYGLLWLIMITIAIVRWRTFRDRTILMVWLLFLLHLGIYALIFLVTPWNVHEHLSVALDRLVLHVVPLGGLLITLHHSSLAEARGTDPYAKNLKINDKKLIPKSEI